MWCRQPPIVRRRRPSRRNGSASAVGDGGDIALAEDSEICFGRSAALPVPALSHLDWHTTDLGLRTSRRGRGVPLPPAAPWPRQTTLPPVSTLAALPVPAASLFNIPESARLTLLAPSPRRAAAAQARLTEASSAKVAGKSRRQAGAAAPSHRRPPDKPSIAAKRRRGRHQAGGASQAERAIGSGRRVEEALIGGS